MNQTRPDQAAAVSAEAPPLLHMTQTTPACLWNDSATPAELRAALGWGAVGATCNPVIALNALNAELLAYEGSLSQSDDVMYLKYDELRFLIGDPAGNPVTDTVARRRAERDAALQRRPRGWIGTVTEPQSSAATGDRITGIGGSPGVAEGVARVVHAVDDSDDVADGDVLVCQVTNPAWVVLFTKIAGLVTATGGTTSHPAVLARKFGIPAVVGTSDATHRIATGDRLRVDGGSGTVEILQRAPQSAGGPPLD